MRVATIGGGPAGLYASLLIKKAHPAWDVTVSERNPAGATYGWGVVFSDRTLTSFREADLESYAQIVDRFVMWEAIDVRYRDRVVRCEGQMFSGIARKTLLSILQRRCRELGVRLRFESEIHEPASLADADLVIGADGVRSALRDSLARFFRPSLAEGRSRYIWYGTRCPFDSFTFVFRANEHGLFQVHAYPFDGSTSTFIVECEESAWRAAGLDDASEQESITYCEKLFAEDLRGHALMSNNSKWSRFTTLKNGTWRHGRAVLVGDAAHTAHFSIGSGTKLAMEDAIALAGAFDRNGDVDAALAEYQMDRKPRVERFQEAARQSQAYFENTSRYLHMEPAQFAFHLLTRSGRVDYGELRLRDPHLVERVDRHLSQPQRSPDRYSVAPPGAFAPFPLAGLTLGNRIVIAPPPSYSARAGVPGEAAAEALRRAAAARPGLVMTDVVAVSPEGRITSRCAGLYTPEQVEVWRRAVASLHAAGPAAVAVQLGHAGRRGATRPRGRGSDRPLREGGWPLVSASPIAYAAGSSRPSELDEHGMDRLLARFASGAAAARDAGFDVLQLHMAHGYLLASFLSPLSNVREDAYGGDLERRMRFPLSVFDAVRQAWPSDRPLSVALSAMDWAPGGAGLDAAVSIARALAGRGCDLVQVLAGQTLGEDRPRYDPYFLTAYSDRIRNEARVATMSAGDIATTDRINTIVGGGRADLCVLRPPDRP